MTAGEADNVGARFERSMRKKPPKVLRNKLNLDFAVLLMRSSYNALDELGETSVLNGIILLVSARLFNMLCLSSC